jgi:hypothetical protein
MLIIHITHGATDPLDSVHATGAGILPLAAGNGLPAGIA